MGRFGPESFRPNFNRVAFFFLLKCDEAVLTSTYNLCKNKKNNVYPCKPQFYYIKVGFKGGGGGSKLYSHVFVVID